MIPDGVGYGAGTKDLDGQANVLRVLLGELAEGDATLGRHVESDRVAVMETNVDDSTPEQLADCADRLMTAGALDVFQVPCTMKKGRVGVMLTVIAPSSRIALLEGIIFEHSTSIGVRRHVVDRHKLSRQSTTVETKFGPIRGKVVTLPSGQSRFSIEDDDARALATSNQTTAADVRKEAATSWEQCE
jgi:uncharacterized protein (DUF111 family)